MAVAVGHLNNDIYLDIAVVSSGTNQIKIFLNDGNGSFAKPRTYSTGLFSRPVSVVVADINGDQWTDIIIGNSDSHTIAVLFGQNNGTFDNLTETFLGPSRPVSIALGDLNNDTWLDVVLANNGTHSISVLLGNGRGTFDRQMMYPTGYDSFPSAVAIADLNNDGRLDVAVANYGTDNICIFLGHGNGTLTLGSSLSTDHRSNPCDLALADLNDDDRLDIIVANYHANNVGVFLGYGDGTFSIQKTYFLGVGFNPYSIAAGYIDHDQQLDIVVSNLGGDSITLLIDNGNGSFATPATYSLSPGSSPSGLTVGDFDNNNQSDVVLANFNANNIAIFIRYTSISSKSPKAYPVDRNSSPNNVAIADVNMDNNPDLIVPNYNVPSVSVLLGYGNGSYAEQMKFSTGNGTRPYTVAIADFDNDNIVDIVVASSFADHLSLLLGYGNGSFTLINALSYEQMLSIYSVAAGDFNGDQNIDVVLADFGSSRILILLGYGNGSFEYVQSYTTDDNGRPKFVVVDDFNNDKYLDIATANYATNNVGIFLGYGNGSFFEQTTFFTGDASLPYRMAVGHINNDSCLDIVVATEGSHDVGLLRGYCNGTFAAWTTCLINPQFSLTSVAIGDVNDDHWLDIVVADMNLNNINIALGYGNGSFATPIAFSTGINSAPYAVAISDLNHDHRLDVVVANSGTGNVAILLGRPHTGMNNTAEFLLGDYYFDFVTRIYYSTGASSHPYSIAVGDFNNDTHLDAVVANSGTDTIGVLLGDGSGFLLNETIYYLSTTSQPRLVIVADFDKDHRLDIAVANFLGGSISIFHGHGNGSFDEPLTIAIGSNLNPSSLTSGDLNNDGWLDLVVTDSTGNTIELLFGFRYASFQRPIRSTTGINTGPCSVAVADFNNDGRLDVVTANYGRNNVGILLGYGNGTFTPPTMYANINESHPWSVAVADFNNDTRLDIAIAVWGRNQMGVILGNGDGTFGEPLLYFVGPGTRPASITTADFNNDHHPDIATTNYGSSSVSVFLGYGNGSFAEARVFSTGNGSNPRAATIADLDNDHCLDIVVSNEATFNVGVLYGKGDGTFEDVTVYLVTPNSIPQYALSGDLNNDSLPDIAVTMYESGEIGVFLGYGNRTFSPLKLYSSGSESGVHGLQFNDFNDDQYVDIIVTSLVISNISILFGNGDGTFKDAVLYDTGPNAALYSIAVADFNNDDVVDVVFSDGVANEIGVLFRNGYQSFGGFTALSYANDSKPSSVAVGHLNNDTYLDIVIANSGNDSVGILHGHGNGTFTKATMYSTGDASQPSSVALADFNYDTLLDIVVTNSFSNTIGVLLGSSDETFDNVITFSTGLASYPVSIAAGDFNYDDKLDIVVANFGTNNVAILTGDGNGSFADPIFYLMNYDSRPNWVIFGHFNNYNSTDIAVANYGADNIKILLNCPAK